jgi:ABC-type oligopeptide transport system substrate-binding subunit
VDGTRSALIVASDQYTDPGLGGGGGSGEGAKALAAVLQNPGIGGFEVRTLLNEAAPEVNEAVEEFFDDRRPDDLLLLHFSCHGVKDEGGELYFATTNTKLRRLGATAVAADFVNRRMGRSRSRRIVLLLDCCYAGAFERGMTPRAGSGVAIEEQFSGRGRAVITASSAMEYAFEGDELADTSEQAPSVFTSALVEGLETGEADRDQDGLVALDELYDYVYDRVRAATPNQTPGKWAFGVQGDLYIARRARPVTTPARLPPELQQLVDHPVAVARIAAVQELARLLGSQHAGLVLAARQALERLTEDDSRMVSAAATAALEAKAKQEAEARAKQEADAKAKQEADAKAKQEADAKAKQGLPRLEVSERQIDFGRVTQGAEAPRRTIRVINAGGGDLNPSATTTAKWLRLQLTGDQLTVVLDTSTSGRFESEILVQSNGGSLTIGIVALIEPQPILSVKPKNLDFGRLVLGQHDVSQRIEISNEGGGVLNWDYRVDGDFFDVRRDGDTLVVQPQPHTGRHSGAIFVQGNGDEETVTVAALIEDDVAGATAQERSSSTEAHQRPTPGKGLALVKQPSSSQEHVPNGARAVPQGVSIPRIWTRSGPRLLIAIFAVAIALAGIFRYSIGGSNSGRSGGAVNVAAANAKRGGVLRTATTDFGFTNGFDPTGEYLGSALTLYGALLRTLVTYKHVAGVEGNKLYGDLATEVPQPTDNGLTYTYKLKPNIKFGPPVNRAITSKDVAYAFQRINAEPLIAQYGFYYINIVKGMDGKAKSADTKISGIETPDDQTIVFHLTKPTGDFNHRLSMPATGPIPKEVASCHKKAEDYGRYVISSGPYMIQGSDQLDISSCGAQKPISGFDPSKKLYLIRNPSYNQSTDNTRTNYVDGIRIDVNSNLDDIFNKVEAGDLDSNFADQPPATVVQKYLTDPNKKKLMHVNNADRTSYITMNWATPPFDDIHVRKAANWVMDKQGILQAWGGTTAGEIATHNIPPTVLNDQLKADYNPYPSQGNRGDEAKAKQEMRQTKYDSNKDGVCDASVCKNLVMINRNYGAWADSERVVVSSLQKIGIQVKPRRLATTTAYTTIQTVKNMIPIALNASWGKDYPDAYTFAEPLFTKDAILPTFNTNYALLGLDRAKASELGIKFPAGVQIPNPTAEIQKCQKLSDPDPRTDCFVNIDKMLMEQAVPWIPCLWNKIVSITAPSVTKYEFDQFSGYISVTEIAVNNGAEIN